jgi:hypothetical protein
MQDIKIYEISFVLLLMLKEVWKNESSKGFLEFMIIFDVLYKVG